MAITSASRAYLSLGSDLGDRIAYLQAAADQLSALAGTIISISPVYETPPWGFDSKSSFLNICIAIDTNLDVRELLKITQEIEIRIGREKHLSKKYTSRIIDLDIIFFGSIIIKENKLQIPHPHYMQRRFVLTPLKDIAANALDPITHLSVRQLAENCIDPTIIKVYQKNIV
jgi:deoxyguanosine kinase